VRLRERAARWLAKEDAKQKADNDLLHAQLCLAELQARAATATAYKLRHALTEIATLETPNANGTVRKMARLAREAVKCS